MKPLLLTLALAAASLNAQPADLVQKAHSGDAQAQTELGILYHSGDGVAQDYGKAREWLEKAAAQGDTAAQQVLKRLLWK